VFFDQGLADVNFVLFRRREWLQYVADEISMSAFDRTIQGSSPAFLEVINAARIVAATDVTALLSGETGTGKEFLARVIHAESPRAAKPFLTINCASLTEQLADSLLFGHRRGAFTAADSDNVGYIRSAGSGTLFLDEVGELPLATQARLLRFLESGECLPIGEVTPVRVDVRIIAATNRELSAEVAASRFRQDLFFRLNIVPLVLPPLRERSEEILGLFRYFVEQACETYKLEPPLFDTLSLRLLREYPWPGNVRELRNLAKRMVILLGGRDVTPDNLPAEIRTAGTVSDAESAGGFRLPAEGIVMDQLEADVIRQALARTAGNRSRAARLLGISRDTLLYRLKKHSIA
jgi:DNA-binding NtrC family response regulator